MTETQNDLYCLASALIIKFQLNLEEQSVVGFEFKCNIPTYESSLSTMRRAAAITVKVVAFQNNFKKLFNNSLCSYMDSVLHIASAMNSTLITFINYTLKKKNKIIMTVFILIKHYTRSTRMNWLELSRLCINAFSVFALFS